MRRLILCFFLLGVSQLAKPETVDSGAGWSVELRQCLEDTNNIYTHEKGICIVREVERKDAEIKKVINRKTKWIFSKDNVGPSPELRKVQARELRESQNSWLAYRESWCRFVADMIDGTSRPLEYVDCKLKLTIIRLADLNAQDG